MFWVDIHYHATQPPNHYICYHTGNHRENIEPQQQERKGPTSAQFQTELAIQLVCPYIIHSTHEQTSTVLSWSLLLCVMIMERWVYEHILRGMCVSVICKQENIRSLHAFLQVDQMTFSNLKPYWYALEFYMFPLNGIKQDHPQWGAPPLRVKLFKKPQNLKLNLKPTSGLAAK